MPRITCAWCKQDFSSTKFHKHLAACKLKNAVSGGAGRRLESVEAHRERVAKRYSGTDKDLEARISDRVGDDRAVKLIMRIIAATRDYSEGNVAYVESVVALQRSRAKLLLPGTTDEDWDDDAYILAIWEGLQTAATDTVDWGSDSSGTGLRPGHRTFVLREH